jgi:hypothetical protein
VHYLLPPWILLLQQILISGLFAGAICRLRLNSARQLPLSPMEVAVNAIAYGGLCRTNSADVKNIAYDEQSHCHFDWWPARLENQQRAANLVETQTQRRPTSSLLAPPQMATNGKLTALTLRDPFALVRLSYRR